MLLVSSASHSQPAVAQAAGRRDWEHQYGAGGLHLLQNRKLSCPSSQQSRQWSYLWLVSYLFNFQSILEKVQSSCFGGRCLTILRGPKTILTFLYVREMEKLKQRYDGASRASSSTPSEMPRDHLQKIVDAKKGVGRYRVQVVERICFLGCQSYEIYSNELCVSVVSVLW